MASHTACVGILSWLDELGSALAEAMAAAGITVRTETVTADAETLTQWANGLTIAVITAPFDTIRQRLPEVRSLLRGKVVVSAATETSYDSEGYYATSGMSVTERLATGLPDSHVVGAFHLLGRQHLTRATALEAQSDVPVTGDDEDALMATESLIDEMPGLHAVRAGPLRLTGAIEGFVPLLRQMEDDCGYPLGVTFGEHGIQVRW